MSPDHPGAAGLGTLCRALRAASTPNPGSSSRGTRSRVRRLPTSPSAALEQEVPLRPAHPRASRAALPGQADPEGTVYTCSAPAVRTAISLT